jgi:hypothetical protein
MTKQPVHNPAKVLLVAGTWDNLAEMPYLLRQAGYCPDILCHKENICRHSSFLHSWIDSGNTWETLIATLIDLDRSAVYSHIILGEDPLIWHIFIKPIKELVHLIPIREPNARAMMGKVEFSQLCRWLNIPTPDFAIIQKPEDGLTVLNQLGVPLATKVNHSAASEGVKVFHNPDDLYSYLAYYDFKQILLAQQFIEGELINVEALFCNGHLLEYVCSLSLDITLGPSTKRRYIPRLPEVGMMLNQLGKFTKLHGFANISILRETKSARLFLIEADPRPNRWHAYGHWFGADFAEAFRLFMNNDQLTQPPYLNLAAEKRVTNWDIEHFDSYFLKLYRANQTLESIHHLLDFDLTLRYVLHDPDLLREKTKRLREKIQIRSSV